MTQVIPTYVFGLRLQSIIQTEKSVDGVLGIQTQGRRMVDAYAMPAAQSVSKV